MFSVGRLMQDKNRRAADRLVAGGDALSRRSLKTVIHCYKTAHNYGHTIRGGVKSKKRTRMHTYPLYDIFG